MAEFRASCRQHRGGSRPTQGSKWTPTCFPGSGPNRVDVMGHQQTREKGDFCCLLSQLHFRNG